MEAEAGKCGRVENGNKTTIMAAASTSQVLMMLVIGEKVSDEVKDIQYLGNISNPTNITKDTIQE